MKCSLQYAEETEGRLITIAQVGHIISRRKMSTLGAGSLMCCRRSFYTVLASSPFPVLVPWFPFAVQNSDDGSLEVHRSGWFDEKRLDSARQGLSLRLVIP